MGDDAPVAELVVAASRAAAVAAEHAMSGPSRPESARQLVAPLSSMGSTLEDLVARISALAEGERTAKHEDTVAALEEIERQLRSSSRRLGRLLRELDRR